MRKYFEKYSYCQNTFLKWRLLLVVSFFFLSCTTYAQTERDSLERLIDKKINEVYEDSYYSDLGMALREFRLISTIATDHKLWHKNLEVLTNMAWCADHHNNIDSLLFYINASKEFLKFKFAEIQKDDASGQYIVNLLHTTGMYYWALNDYDKAIYELKKIINHQEHGLKIDSLNISAASTYIGDSYFRLQNFHEAENYFALALQWLPLKNSNYDKYINYDYYFSANQAHLGKCNFAQAKKGWGPELYSQALKYFETAIKSSSPETPQNLNLTTINYNRISQVYFEQGKYDSALIYLTKTARLLKPTDILMAETHIFFGNVYLKQKEWSAALEQYEKGLAVVNHYVKGPHYRKAEIAYRKGQVYALQQEHIKALEQYQQAIAIVVEGFEPADIYSHPGLKEVLSEKDLLQAFLLKGQALFQVYLQSGGELKNLDAALQNYQLAAELVDKMRNNFQAPEYKEYIASSSNALYESAIEAAYTAYQHTQNPEYIGKAFYFAEKNKSRILLEAVKSSSLTDYGNLPPELLEKERSLQARLSFLNNELVKSKNADDTESVYTLRNQLLETNLKRDQLTKTIQEKYPAFYQLKYDTRVAGIKEVQKSLSAKAAALEYFYGDSAVYIFGISQDRISLTKFDQVNTRLDTLVQDFLSKIKSPPGLNNSSETLREYIRQSSLLYKSLLKPALDQLNAVTSFEELLIIPDGPLGYLPFEVLLTDTEHSSATSDYSRLPYLVNSSAIRYEFSGTLSLYEGEKDRSTGNPNPYAGFAPAYAASDKTSGALPPLKNNQGEVKRVSELFQGLSFLGKEASEEAFKTYASQSSILHLSMHALANDHNPLSSGLAFSTAGSQGTIPEKVDGDSASDDGFLFLYELYNISLQAELAILSACQTGGGKLSRGEGIISLGRAFKYAGCPNIVMSLWNANDHTTAGIMQSYSRYLLEGVNKAEALRKAKLDYLQTADNNLSHPYYWSTFILLGDNKSIETTSTLLSFSLLTQPEKIVVFLVAIAFLITIFFFVRYRKAKP